MKLDLFKILVDFGLVILIWLVQLCIYPAFSYFKENQLLKWHEAYTPRITIVVLPLMLAQIGLSIFFLYQELSTLTLIDALLVLLTWITTFIIYVPLHQKIGSNQMPLASSKKLVQYNWIRVFLWNLIFIINIIT